MKWLKLELHLSDLQKNLAVTKEIRVWSKCLEG